MENLVSIEWLAQQLNNPNLIIIDASQTENKSKQKPLHPTLKIKGAVPFSLKNFSDTSSNFPNTIPSPNQFEEEARKLGINSDSSIVVYDNLGIYTSPRVWWLFKTMGHQNIAVLNGGLNAWIKQQLPTENIQTVVEKKRGNFSANFQPQYVRDFDAIKANLDNRKEIVIDARSYDRFHSLVPEPRADLRSGNIPNSINLPYTKVIEDGHYLTKEVLSKLFDSLKIPTDQTIIFSCGSGITACIISLAYQQINNSPTSIYDGSWTEWAQLSPE